MKGLQLIDYDVGIDIKLDHKGRIESGLVIGDILAQNQAIILNVHKGEIKENPALGVGIEDMLLDNDYPVWRSAIRENLEMDGQNINTIKISETGIVIDASY